MRIDDRDPFVVGEPLSRWLSEQRAVSSVVETIERSRNKDLKWLKEQFQLTRDAVFWTQTTSPMRVTIKDHYKSWIWRFAIEQPRSAEERYVRIAGCWAQTMINEALSGTGGEEGQHLVVARVLVERDRFSIRVVPRTLLGAIWYQVARYLSENPEARRCANCGQWFEVSLKARRTNTKFCSNSCRVARHRRNKAERRLDSNGSDPKE